MIIFGQGAIRCHPYLLKEMQAATDPDEEAARTRFDEALIAHVGFTLSNAARALVDGLTRSAFAGAPRDAGPLSAYYRRLGRMSAAFALVADVALLHARRRDEAAREAVGATGRRAEPSVHGVRRAQALRRLRAARRRPAPRALGARALALHHADAARGGARQLPRALGRVAAETDRVSARAAVPDARRPPRDEGRAPRAPSLGRARPPHAGHLHQRRSRGSRRASRARAGGRDRRRARRTQAEREAQLRFDYARPEETIEARAQGRRRSTSARRSSCATRRAPCAARSTSMPSPRTRRPRARRSRAASAPPSTSERVPRTRSRRRESVGKPASPAVIGCRSPSTGGGALSPSRRCHRPCACAR